MICYRNFLHPDKAEELNIYFNWSINVLMPVHPPAADHLLKTHKDTIVSVAHQLLSQLNYTPQPFYRGVIFRKPVDKVVPHPEMQYLSFSDDRKIAEHFADINGFGSDILDVTQQLGTYGYVIEYTPIFSELLFHHAFLSVLPYAEAFTRLGHDGAGEVASLKRQKEVVILQPSAPFTNITKQTPSTRNHRSPSGFYISHL